MTAKKDDTISTEETTGAIDPAIASDVDGDGLLDLDPAKAQATLADLVIIDHNLRDHGSSLADVLRHVAWSAKGIREV